MLTFCIANAYHHSVIFCKIKIASNLAFLSVSASAAYMPLILFLG
ncbi:Uncharacterized protein dnm_019270 [Desulfonema magnum]|uniref:Uncharacterized protein n=1 Tax=Desulfonema magnum TaxID=45655 RepID=A0A975BIE9_9BACT|nr:Uncharacterized protein dnm_019270 [Desulfonema magnum]